MNEHAIMNEHVETLRRLRASVGGEDTRAALTAAIEALDPEPGQPIGRVGCPACGARLEIEHGEESGLAAMSDSGGLREPGDR